MNLITNPNCARRVRWALEMRPSIQTAHAQSSNVGAS
jgi:hypothetical protein